MCPGCWALQLPGGQASPAGLAESLPRSSAGRVPVFLPTTGGVLAFEYWDSCPGANQPNNTPAVGAPQTIKGEIRQSQASRLPVTGARPLACSSRTTFYVLMWPLENKCMFAMPGERLQQAVLSLCLPRISSGFSFCLVREEKAAAINQHLKRRLLLAKP